MGADFLTHLARQRLTEAGERHAGIVIARRVQRQRGNAEEPVERALMHVDMLHPPERHDGIRAEQQPAHHPQPGDIAVISQSAAIAAALVEWGAGRSVGFSAVASLGDELDVDFADLLDFFARDFRTRAIVLYVESIRDARKFMSAARAAARLKPVVVVKSDRHARPANVPRTHSAMLASPRGSSTSSHSIPWRLRYLAPSVEGRSKRACKLHAAEVHTWFWQC